MFLNLWLALWLVGLQVQPAERGSPPPRGSIQGVVIRAGAAALGIPDKLGDARVELNPGKLSDITFASGTFSFRNLPPGEYTISVRRDGFIPQEDRSRGLTPSGLRVTLGPGQALKDIVFPMIPGPVIVGKVIDPYGTPLAAALVRTYERLYTPYGTQLRAVSKGMTNDMGEFRLFGLNFGEYFVSAGYGDRDRAAAIGPVKLSANVTKADDGYATVFYDGADDLTRAEPAHLSPGSDPGTLNIYLSESARFRIRGQVLPPIAGTKIVLTPKGSDLSYADFFVQPDARGAFEIRGVSPGDYLLLATANDGALSSDVVPVTVRDMDVDGVRLGLQETLTIPGALSVEGNPRANPAGSKIKLTRSRIEFDQSIEAPVAIDGTFALQHVAAQAQYDVVVEPTPSGTYVKSIASGGIEILRGNARLLPNQLLRVELGVATDTLDVHVTKGSEPAPGIQVVLIPDVSLQRRADRYVTDYTGTSGDLHLSGVPPGRYTAYAFEHIEAGAYYALTYSPSASGHFRDRAVPVNVGQNGTKSIRLTVIPVADTAGILQ
jgi:hypothetical protein